MALIRRDILKLQRRSGSNLPMTTPTYQGAPIGGGVAVGQVDEFLSLIPSEDPYKNYISTLTQTVQKMPSALIEPQEFIGGVFTRPAGLEITSIVKGTSRITFLTGGEFIKPTISSQEAGRIASTAFQANLQSKYWSFSFGRASSLTLRFKNVGSMSNVLDLTRNPILYGL